MKRNPASSQKRAGETREGESLLAAETVSIVGDHIRSLRSERRMTLKELAQHAGVSSSLLSLVERGKAAPSIASLVAVAAALRVHVSDLFNTQAVDRSNPVHRREEQPVFTTSDGTKRRIVASDHDEGIEIFYSEYGPGAGMRKHFRYPGVDYGLVIMGKLLVEVDGQEFELRKGDSISYDAESPHRIQNRTETTARVVWVKLGRRRSREDFGGLGKRVRQQ